MFGADPLRVAGADIEAALSMEELACGAQSACEGDRGAGPRPGQQQRVRVRIGVDPGRAGELDAPSNQALCVIDREQGGADALAAESISLLALLTAKDLRTAVAS